MGGRDARGGRKVRPRTPEEGYRPDIAVLQRIKARVDMDQTNDPSQLVRLSRTLATAIETLNGFETASIATRRNPKSRGSRRVVA